MRQFNEYTSILVGNMESKLKPKIVVTENCLLVTQIHEIKETEKKHDFVTSSCSLDKNLFVKGSKTSNKKIHSKFSL